MKSKGKLSKDSKKTILSFTMRKMDQKTQKFATQVKILRVTEQSDIKD